MRHTSLFFGVRFQESYLAVDLFFALSGVVIANAYEARLHSTLSFKTFMSLRLIRLWPLYILGTALTVLAVGFGIYGTGGAGPFTALVLLSLFMFPDIADIGGHLYPLNYPAWSLFFELVVNALYGKFVFLLKNRWLVLLMGLSALGLAGCMMIADDHTLQDMGWNFDTMGGGLFRAGYSFFAGALLYRLFSSRKNSFQITGHDASLTLLGIIGLITILLISMPGIALRPYFDFLAVTLIFPAIIYGALYVSPSGFAVRVCAFMGTTSYALYTLHVPVGILARGLLNNQFGLSIEQHAPQIGFVFMGLLIGFCWLIDIIYDLPFRRFLLKKMGQKA